MSIKSNLPLLIAASLLLSSLSCRTTQLSNKSRSNQIQPKQSAKKTPKRRPSKYLTGHQFDEFFQNFSRGNISRMEYFRKKIGQKWRKNSLDEAVVCLTTLMQVQRKRQSQQTVSLEIATLDNDIDLQAVLASNPYLQNFQVFRLAQFLNQKTKNSESFASGIRNLIAAKRKEWLSLQLKRGFVEQDLKEEPLPLSNGSHQESLNDLSTADLLIADSILVAAEQAAEAGNYKQAIEIAQKIPSAEPLHELAIQKIRDFSNRAVTKLRLQAAQAFQSAIPSTDGSTKQSYLILAKEFLEEALQDYPQSDHLETVRENLAIISKDLEGFQ